MKPCRSGKRQHPTAADARRLITLLLARSRVRGERVGVPMRAYLCDDCGHWHVGHDYEAARALGFSDRDYRA